ncbi:MAG: GatB/YqeY domain-containing protein [Proteobacteria bacterium]|nr:GatB/YqeY domain-containing protein [Pseudomonadota bacterium]
MSLKERINEDLKKAMKARDKERTSVLRMLLSEIKYTQAAVNVHAELPEAEVLKVVGLYHKRMLKSLDDYPEGEKRDQIRSELGIVDEYLPKRASRAEVEQVVDEVLRGTEDREFGPLMKQVLARLGTAADGKVVSEVLKPRLAKP